MAEPPTGLLALCFLDLNLKELLPLDVAFVVEAVPLGYENFGHGPDKLWLMALAAPLARNKGPLEPWVIESLELAISPL